MVSATANGSRTQERGRVATSPTDVIQLDVFDFLQRRKGLIFLGLLVGLLLSLLYVLVTKTIYESKAEILIIQKDSKLTTSSNAEFGFESTVGEELLATHMRIISSPKVIRDALVECDLMMLPSLLEELDSDDLVDEKTTERAVVEYVRENLEANRGGEGEAKNAQVLEVAFKHTSEQDCSSVLLAIVDSYQTFLGKTVKGAGDEAADLISKASVELDNKLKEQDRVYKHFLENSPVLWTEGDAINPHQVRVSQLESELANLQVKRGQVESRLELTRSVIQKNNSGADDPLAKLTVLDGDDLERLSMLIQLDRGYPASEQFESRKPEMSEVANVEYQRLLALNLEAKQNDLKYGPNHPKSQATRGAIKKTEDFLAKRGAQNGGDVLEGTNDGELDLDRLLLIYEKLLGNDALHLSRRESELLSFVDAEKLRAKELITVELEESSLRRDMDRTERLYDAVVERLREINLLKDYGGYITEVISPVEIGEKAWPKVPLVLLLGSMVGLLCGSGVSVAAELADLSFRTPKELEDELGLPILTHVPALSTTELEKKDLGGIDPCVVSVHVPRSRQAEAFRTLRTSILFKTKASEQSVIQVTSPNAGDGKSTIVSNLAVSLSQASKRVLLIDCDLRRPTLHKVFGLDQQPGMSAILAGDIPMEEAITSRPEIPNLSIIPAGEIPPNPAELLALPSLSQFLEVAKEEFDYILIDSPPVSPVSDPLTIASVVDYVLLGLTLRKNSRTAAARTSEELANNGANLIGLVVNRVSKESKSYQGGYGYGYGSYQSNYAYGGRFSYHSPQDSNYYK